MAPAIFLDKDGTVLVDVPYNADPAKMRFAPGARTALQALGACGAPLIIASNQPGVALDMYPLAALDGVQARLAEMFEDAGATLHACYFCPHHPRGTVAAFTVRCDCRKPAPGLLRQAAAEHGIDLSASWFVGDILNDVEAGRRAGCRTVLIDNGNETEWHMTPLRTPDAVVPDLAAAARIILADARLAPVATQREVRP
jgi:histidinol-phosphate phosphatase family protein